MIKHRDNNQTLDKRNSKILSICIPAYNRKYIFKWCLISACEACKGYENLVEIVISDNASTEELYSVVNDVKNLYPLIDIIYSCNSTNIGMAGNIFKVVENAIGQFCWVIGSDDFIKQDSINKIIHILRENEDIDFISCSFDLIKIDDRLKRSDIEIETNINEQLKNTMYLIPNGAPTESFKVDKLDYIIDPKYNNVLLGSLMTGIFKRKLWNEVEIDKRELNGFDKLINIYPHVYVYSNAFLGKKAYYCGQPLITVGEGNRDWSTDTGKSFWESSLPIIYFKVFGEMVSSYKSNGLEQESYVKCENWVASFAGDLLIPLIWKKYVSKESVDNIDKIFPLETSIIFLDNEIYKQTALNKLRSEYSTMTNQYKNMEKTSIGNIIINLFKDIVENNGFKNVRI